jgi:hypothetical protein
MYILHSIYSINRNRFSIYTPSLLTSAPQLKVQRTLLFLHFLLSEVLLSKNIDIPLYPFFPYTSFLIKAPSLTKILYIYK